MLSFENLKKLFPIKTQLESVTMSDSGKRGTAVSTTIRKVGLNSEIEVRNCCLPKSFFKTNNNLYSLKTV
jgi:hypothetical protein